MRFKDLFLSQFVEGSFGRLSSASLILGSLVGALAHSPPWVELRLVQGGGSSGCINKASWPDGLGAGV